MAYPGVLDDIRTCLRGGLPRQLPVFAMSQVFDAVMSGYTFEELENDQEKLIDSVISGIERIIWKAATRCFLLFPARKPSDSDGF